jgi:hypothetical protein
MEWESRLRAALTEAPYGLSLLRIAVVGTLLISPELHAAPRLAASPQLLVALPEGVQWLAALPLTPQVVEGLRIVAISAGATALLGYWSRVSCGLLALTATLLISFTQRAGAVLHDMHLLWLLALLSVSRCGDACSLDSGLRAVAPASVAFGVPSAFARALLGVVYFFPGLHKLRAAGLDWGSAENVTGILYGKWFQHGRVPFVRIDSLPWLLALGGTAVLLFELSFGVLAVWRRTRLLAFVLGCCFHLATQAFFFIAFPSLVICYVVLLPWPRLLGSRFASRAAGPPRAGYPWASVVVGAVLLVLTSVQGLRGQTQAFPFACYPTFAERSSGSTVDLNVELVGRDGVLWLERDFSRFRSQAEWSRVYALAGLAGGVATDEQLRAWAREQARQQGLEQQLLEARALRFFVAAYATKPEDWQKPPLSRRLLRELEP